MGVIREPMEQAMKSFNIPVSVLCKRNNTIFRYAGGQEGKCWEGAFPKQCVENVWRSSEATHAILSPEKDYSTADIMSFTLSLLPVFLIRVIIVGAFRNFCGSSFDFSSTDVATIIAVFSRIWSDSLGFSLGCRSERKRLVSGGFQQKVGASCESGSWDSGQSWFSFLVPFPQVTTGRIRSGPHPWLG